VRNLWQRFWHDPLRWTLMAIAFGTFVSGILLAVAQGFVLDILSAPTTTSDRLFFGIIGMFMAIVGGMLTQTLLQPPPSPVIVGWSALQARRFGGDVPRGGALGLLALGIALAAFDLLGGHRGRILVAHQALRRASFFFFFVYVALLIVAGAWGSSRPRRHVGSPSAPH
jgi:hypothetical protein